MLEVDGETSTEDGVVEIGPGSTRHVVKWDDSFRDAKKIRRGWETQAHYPPCVVSLLRGFFGPGYTSRVLHRARREIMYRESSIKIIF